MIEIDTRTFVVAAATCRPFAAWLRPARTGGPSGCEPTQVEDAPIAPWSDDRPKMGREGLTP
jgi:hypothetical protein